MHAFKSLLLKNTGFAAIGSISLYLLDLLRRRDDGGDACCSSGRCEVITDRETRARLLTAAARLFAERGFKQVTVREICRAARANVAAVNYHFGDKLGLYREVVQVAIDGIRLQVDRARAADDGAGPEEQLRRFLDYWLRRMSEGGDEPLHRILQRETIEPTPVLDAIIRDALRPRFDYLCELVAAMTGAEPSAPAVKRSVGSIHAQVVLMGRRNLAAERLGVQTRAAPIWTKSSGTSSPSRSQASTARPAADTRGRNAEWRMPNAECAKAEYAEGRIRRRPNARRPNAP